MRNDEGIVGGGKELRFNGDCFNERKRNDFGRRRY